MDYTLNMKTQVGKKFKYYDRVYAQIFLDLASATMKSDVRLFFGYCWCVFDLQYCVSFWCMGKWFSLSISVDIYVYVPMYIIHINYLYIMYMDSFSNSFPI